MTDHDLRDAALRLRKVNRRNKRTVQVKRADSASTKARLEGFTHPRTFPTRYKYG